MCCVSDQLSFICHLQFGNNTGDILHFDKLLLVRNIDWSVDFIVPLPNICTCSSIIVLGLVCVNLCDMFWKCKTVIPVNPWLYACPCKLHWKASSTLSWWCKVSLHLVRVSHTHSSTRPQVLGERVSCSNTQYCQLHEGRERKRQPAPRRQWRDVGVCLEGVGLKHSI